MKKLVHVSVQRPVQGIVVFTLKGTDAEKDPAYSGAFKNTHALVSLVPNTEEGTYYEYAVYAQWYECTGLVSKQIEKGYCIVPEFDSVLDSITVPEPVKENPSTFYDAIEELKERVENLEEFKDNKPELLSSVSGSFNCNDDAPVLTLKSVKDTGEEVSQSVDMSCLSEMMDSKLESIPQPDLSAFATHTEVNAVEDKADTALQDISRIDGTVENIQESIAEIGGEVNTALQSVTGSFSCEASKYFLSTSVYRFSSGKYRANFAGYTPKIYQLSSETDCTEYEGIIFSTAINYQAYYILSNIPVAIGNLDEAAVLDELTFVTTDAYADREYSLFILSGSIDGTEQGCFRNANTVELGEYSQSTKEIAIQYTGTFTGTEAVADETSKQIVQYSDLPFLLAIQSVKGDNSLYSKAATLRVCRNEQSLLATGADIGFELSISSTDGTVTTQTIDMSCLSDMMDDKVSDSVQNISADVHCDVTEGEATPFEHYISAEINALILTEDGYVDDLLHSYHDNGSGGVRSSVTIEASFENTGSWDGIGVGINLLAAGVQNADGKNSYSNLPDTFNIAKCATIEEFLAAGEQGLPLPYVNVSEFSGIDAFAENETLYAAVTDNKDGTYTFTFTVRTPDVTEFTADLVAEKTDGTEQRVDMKPLLQHIGGKIQEVPDEGTLTTVPISSPAKIAGLNIVQWAGFATEQDYCDRTNPMYPENADFSDNSMTVYYEALPSYIYVAVFFVDGEGIPIDTTAYTTALDWDSCTGRNASVAAMLQAPVELICLKYDESTNTYIEIESVQPLFVRCEQVENENGLGLKVTFFQAGTKPVLRLEPSCDTDIDLSPITEKITSVQDQISSLEDDVYCTYEDSTESADAYSVTVPAESGSYATLKKIGGKTVRWNQLIQNGNFEEGTAGWLANEGTFSVADGVATLTCTNTTATRAGCRIARVGYPGVTGHVLFITCEIKFSAIHELRYFDGPGIEPFNHPANIGIFTPSATDTWYTLATIVSRYSVDASGNTSFKVVYSYAGNGDTLQVRNCMSIDLTALYGVGNEPATVEEFRERYPEDYYAYDAGSLVSASVDEVASYDAGNNILDRAEIPEEVQALPGYGWSAGSAYNYIDFERMVYVQNVGGVDLGTLNWAISVADMGAFYCIIPNTKIVPNTTTIGNLICSKYVTRISQNVSEYDGYIAKAARSNKVYITDKNYLTATADEFKASLSGVMLYYELATPVETDISQYFTDAFLAVSPSGSIVFRNANDGFHLPVPSTVKYQVGEWALEQCVKKAMLGTPTREELREVQSQINGIDTITTAEIDAIVA